MKYPRVIHVRRIGAIRVETWLCEDGTATAACWHDKHRGQAGYARHDVGIYGFMGEKVPWWACEPLREALGL